MRYWPPEAVEGPMASWMPAKSIVGAEIAAYRGGWLDRMSKRIPAAIALQTLVFLVFQGSRAAGLMLAGMALFKWGVLMSPNEKGREVA